MIDQFISIAAPGNSFIDVGPLWGQQKISTARSVGATRLAAIDIMPLDDPLWVKLKNELGPLTTETSLIQGDVCSHHYLRYDVVYCCGVIYHHPDPIVFLQKLHTICQKYVILGTTYTDPVIQNSKGRVEIDSGCAFFLPAVSRSTLQILREDWREFLGGRPGGILTEDHDWDFHNLQHWWWLFTKHYMIQICKIVGFDVVSTYTTDRLYHLLLYKTNTPNNKKQLL